MSDFDARAATWDDPVKAERAAVVARAIVETIPIGPGTRLLEYGAGTGLVTQALRDHVGPVTLADTSSGMRAVIAEKVTQGSLPDARIWDLDLATSVPPDEQFDLVVTVLTLHHVPEVDPVLAAFARLLVGGGRLVVVDLEAEDGSFHGEGFTGHHGFVRAWLAERLEAAGFTDVSFRSCHAITRNDGTYPLFMATARRGR
ncbi:MAG: class I SAM-dependent methyltransferase [Actinomycetota bacterium]